MPRTRPEWGFSRRFVVIRCSSRILTPISPQQRAMGKRFRRRSPSPSDIVLQRFSRIDARPIHRGGIVRAGRRIAAGNSIKVPWRDVHESDSVGRQPLVSPCGVVSKRPNDFPVVITKIRKAIRSTTDQSVRSRNNNQVSPRSRTSFAHWFRRQTVSCRHSPWHGHPRAFQPPPL